MVPSTVMIRYVVTGSDQLPSLSCTWKWKPCQPGINPLGGNFQVRSLNSWPWISDHQRTLVIPSPSAQVVVVRAGADQHDLLGVPGDDVVTLVQD